MPCYTPPMPPHAYCKHDDTEVDNYECQVLGGISGLVSKWRYYRNKSDEAVAFLCYLMSYLEKNQDWPTRLDELEQDNKKLIDWWKEHKQFDYDRTHKK